MANHSVWSEGNDRPCIQCMHFGRYLFEPNTVSCAHPQWARVHAFGLRGCSSWERETGADDEDQRGQAASQA